MEDVSVAAPEEILRLPRGVHWKAQDPDAIQRLDWTLAVTAGNHGRHLHAILDEQPPQFPRRAAVAAKFPPGKYLDADQTNMHA
jgi:hypothetical protein